MQQYRVDKIRVPVTIRLDDGLEEGGHVFVAAEPGDQPLVARVQALLAAPGAFFPLEIEGGATVVHNKERVLWCRYEGPVGPVVEVLTARRRVTMMLSDQTALAGDLVADGPPDRRRVLDILNRAERWVLVEARDGDYLVRREAITLVPSAETGDLREEEAFELEATPDPIGVGS